MIHMIGLDDVKGMLSSVPPEQRAQLSALIPGLGSAVCGAPNAGEYARQRGDDDRDPQDRGASPDRVRRMLMALMDKYSDLFALANKIGLKNPDVKEEAGKLKISGQTEYQLDANRLWDNIKTHQGWETEIVANIQAQRSDVFGVHTVVSGDTLSKLAKVYLGDSNRYMEIFKVNKDTLTNPDMIKVGQKLNIPAR